MNWEHIGTVEGSNEQVESYSISVTLRQVEAADLPIIGGFGIDEEEHAELLDDPDILRVLVRVTGQYEGEWDEEQTGEPECWPEPDRFVLGETSTHLAIETLQAHLDGQGPHWENIVAYPRHTSGARERADYYRIQSAIERIVGRDTISAIETDAEKRLEPQWEN